MHHGNVQPVLLRRTTSNVPPSDPYSAGAASAVPQQAPGSGGIVDPREDFIPIADEEPGDWDLAASTHKRKVSGMPLEAEAIYDRASVKTSLEQISDEEEGANMDDASQMSTSEFSDFPHDGSWGGAGAGAGGGYWVAAIRHYLATSSRGVAALALLAMAIALVSTRRTAPPPRRLVPPSPTSPIPTRRT